MSESLDTILTRLNSENYRVYLTQQEDATWTCLVWSRKPRAFQGRGYGTGISYTDALISAEENMRVQLANTPGPRYSIPSIRAPKLKGLTLEDL